jgi:hypothetical protein
MKIRAKFNCNSFTDNGYNREFKFSAVYGKEGENEGFSKATPSGTLSITVDKETAAYDLFKPGKTFYLDFTEAE